MKKIFSSQGFVSTVFTFGLAFIFSQAFSQTLFQLVLHPNATKGKDAEISSLEPNTNFGTHADLLAIAWTNTSVPVTGRALVQFDLSSIPAGAIIVSAKLSLYWNDDASNVGHSTLSGSNACWLRRVTSPWDENTVTWNTQPSTTNLNQVTIPKSTSNTEDYPNIDVTALVKDMITYGNNGFLLKLKKEQYYRSMLFASSDDGDAFRHPKLVIQYAPSPKLAAPQNTTDEFLIYPSVTQNDVQVICKSSTDDASTIELFDLTGKLQLREQVNLSSNNTLHLQSLPNGIYILAILDSNGRRMRTQKIIKE